MKNSGKFPNAAKRFFLLFLPLLTLATVIAAGFLFQELKSQKKMLKAGERREVELLRGVATNDIKSILSDLVLLSSHHVFHQMLENDQLAIRQNLSKIFLDFCKRSSA